MQGKKTPVSNMFFPETGSYPIVRAGKKELYLVKNRIIGSSALHLGNKNWINASPENSCLLPKNNPGERSFKH
ncbi:hypothetical protein MSHOH_2789 [Methanosarcina horonobensis HB-1 = JCM 15518]|uniref:Uncharacterized protein n=1 Tax=Methanosarcina horonobensis HB-1 = JCM 15518 TaxID=1434110 RepID=A0A0E3SG59_9EURY|nr:hypothetical protein [Methanosarcina horonobensis]AKB79272.1 hypothetical protein MSHOH_2789 [Methanosarcina horonobensis HB-1 = JCM 15518]